MKVLLLFLDGVGIGESDPDRNPFLSADLPTLQRLAGVLPTLADPDRRSGDGSTESAFFPLDATLGVDGLPQSGTGQTALLTGKNAPQLFGRHFGPWAPVALRPLLERENLLRRALDRGHTAAFANAYPRGWPGKRPRQLAAIPLAAKRAGLLVRHEEALVAGQAVASGIVNDGWIHGLGHGEVPSVTPRTAGHALASVVEQADLTLYAHYATDQVGHRGGMAAARAALETVDEFLAGVLDHVPANTLVLLTSDHGNIEDVTRGHTRNPALGMLVGPDAHERSEPLESLLDVAGAVLRWVSER